MREANKIKLHLLLTSDNYNKQTNKRSNERSKQRTNERTINVKPRDLQAHFTYPLATYQAPVAMSIKYLSVSLLIIYLLSRLVVIVMENSIVRLV